MVKTIFSPSTEPIRCKWVGNNSLARDYHDHIWGKKPRQDRGYFEALCIEIFEAGLNFKLILGKLEHLRKQYKNFEPERVVRMKDGAVDKILEDANGIRSRVKAEAIIHNAGIVLELAGQYGSFGKWVERVAKWQKSEVEKEFKKLFKFAGATIVYEFLTSTGHWETPHEEGCFMRKHVQ